MTTLECGVCKGIDMTYTIEDNREASKTDARNNVLKTLAGSTWGKAKETVTAIGRPMNTKPFFTGL